MRFRSFKRRRRQSRDSPDIHKDEQHKHKRRALGDHGRKVYPEEGRNRHSDEGEKGNESPDYPEIIEVESDYLEFVEQEVIDFNSNAGEEEKNKGAETESLLQELFDVFPITKPSLIDPSSEGEDPQHKLYYFLNRSLILS